MLRPGGVLAIWSYARVEAPSCQELDEALRAHYARVERFWPSERSLVDARYAGVHLPGAPARVAPMSLSAEVERSWLVGYAGTWSATRRFRDERGEDPSPLLDADLEAAWPNEPRCRVEWPLTVLAARISAR